MKVLMKDEVFQLIFIKSSKFTSTGLDTPIVSGIYSIVCMEDKCKIY